MNRTPASRLSPEKRREAILDAVREVFAEKGFHGATTRELASAAGISEALMLRHFPTKEALYEAVLEASCRSPEAAGAIGNILALQPSTSTLVLLVHFFYGKVLLYSQKEKGNAGAMHRLMLQSVQGDGEFARMMMKRGPAFLVKKLEQCLAAAIDAGDAVETPVKRPLRAWFAHHLAIMIMLNSLPEPPVVDYGLSREKVIEQAVTFVLRGMGLKDQAIQRHYNPQALSLFQG